MALSATATIAEYRAAWESVVKLQNALRFIAQGNPRTGLPLTEDVQLQALVDDVQAKLALLEA